MNNSEITGLIKQNPRPPRSGGASYGPSAVTIARRNLLQSNPGEWFLWKENSKTGSESGQALRTLIGVVTLKGINRKTMQYEAVSRLNENGKYNIYARYVGEERQYAKNI